MYVCCHKKNRGNGTVKKLSTEQLRQMEGQEGLVLQGCGGDLQEWVDGINDLLTKSLFNISPRTSFRLIFRRSALLNLEIHKGFLRFRALTGKKSAQKSAHAEILNRL